MTVKIDPPHHPQPPGGTSGCPGKPTPDPPAGVSSGSSDVFSCGNLVEPGFLIFKHKGVDMDTIESINAMDEDYKRKTAHLTITEKSGRKKKAYNTGKCWWPGCERNAVAIGLCKYHKMRDNNGTLLRIDQHAFPRDEVLQMYRDVIAFAERAGISVDEAVAWLVAEGLNSFERRSRG
jgi:hypothetical protein